MRRPAMHLDEETIQRLLHGELSPEMVRAAEEHLNACPTCSSLVEDARREEEEVFGLLAGLGHPVPPLTVAGIQARQVRTRASRFRWAAGIIAALGISTAAYASPGSPLPAWIDELLGRSEPEEEAGTPSTGQPGRESPGGGIAVAPGANFTVHFGSPKEGGTITVTLEEGSSELQVEAAVGQATFISDVGSLRVEPEGPTAEFLVKIPSNAPSVIIQLDGETVFSRQGEETTTDALQDDLGRWLIGIPADGSRHPPGEPNGLGGQLS
jgi:hypothetical protein